jgi:hypothetical protein
MTPGPLGKTSPSPTVWGARDRVLLGGVQRLLARLTPIGTLLAKPPAPSSIEGARRSATCENRERLDSPPGPEQVRSQ